MLPLSLSTPRDLFEKAESDLAQLTADPGNPHVAFNLFVTIEHLADWLDMKSERRQHAELRVVSHLANGLKHFRVDRHRSVDRTRVDSYAEEDYAESGYFEERLVIHVTVDEIPFIGDDQIDAVDLARRALEFWRQHLP